MAYRNSSLDTLRRLEHMRGLCEREPGPGVLAFVNGEVAAWCSIAPKCTYRALVNSRAIPILMTRRRGRRSASGCDWGSGAVG
jgi:hypothetical protein